MLAYFPVFCLFVFVEAGWWMLPRKARHFNWRTPGVGVLCRSWFVKVAHDIERGCRSVVAELAAQSSLWNKSGKMSHAFWCWVLGLFSLFFRHALQQVAPLTSALSALAEIRMVINSVVSNINVTRYFFRDSIKMNQEKWPWIEAGGMFLSTNV